MLPCDFRTAGPIVDDEIYSRFVLPMREGVHVVSSVSTVQYSIVSTSEF
jgi:hypothetical protein